MDIARIQKAFENQKKYVRKCCVMEGDDQTKEQCVLDRGVPEDCPFAPVVGNKNRCKYWMAKKTGKRPSVKDVWDYLKQMQIRGELK